MKLTNEVEVLDDLSHAHTHTHTCVHQYSEDFHIDLRNDSTFDQSSGTVGQILIAAKSILPLTKGSKVMECLAVWLFNGTLKGFSVSQKDNKWSRLEVQTGSH